MDTIDDLQFPAMDAAPTELVLKRDVLLPDRQILLRGIRVKLSHTGIHAVIETESGTVFKY